MTQELTHAHLPIPQSEGAPTPMPESPRQTLMLTSSPAWKLDFHFVFQLLMIFMISASVFPFLRWVQASALHNFSPSVWLDR